MYSVFLANRFDIPISTNNIPIDSQGILSSSNLLVFLVRSPSGAHNVAALSMASLQVRTSYLRGAGIAWPRSSADDGL